MKATRALFRLVTILIVGTAGLGCATDASIMDQADEFHGSLRKAVINDPELRNYLQAVGDRVIEEAREASRAGQGPKAHKSGDNEWMFSKKMTFHFVNSKTLNAFTTGGEHMYIYTELFQQCKTEDELAAVVAHEYAHVYCRHVQQGTNRQYAILGLAAAAAGAGAVAGGSDNALEYGAAAGGAALIVGKLAGMGFTRSDEAQADEYGFLFYTHAGWDPNHFGDFFQTMIDQGHDKGPEFLSDHPSLKSRVDKSKERAQKLGPDAARWRRPPVADGQAFRRLQARAKQVGANMPSDKSLEGTQELLRALPRSCLTPAVEQDQIDAQKKLQTDMQAAEQRSAKKKKKGNPT